MYNGFAKFAYNQLIKTINEKQGQIAYSGANI